MKRFEKVIIFGVGRISDRIFSVFPDSLDYVECFVDSFCTCRTFYGIPVEKPNALQESKYEGVCVVIAANRREEEIKGILEHFGFSCDRVVNIREWIINILIKHDDVRLIPHRVRIDAGTYCQLNCVDCYMRNRDDIIVGEGNLKYNDFCDFITENSYIEEIELSDNGEVFLNPDIDRIFGYAYSQGIKITLTNGVNLNTVSEKVLEDVVRYKVQHITVSIDGASNEVYSGYRRGGNFDVVINNIRKLNEFKRKYHSDFPKLSWQFVLMQQNECDAEAAKKMADDLGMSIYYKLSFAGEFVPQNREKLQEITGLECFNRREYENKYGINYMYPVCEHMIWQPQINWDGRLLGCCNNYTYGDWNKNVFKESFVTAINEDPYRSMVIKLLGGKISVNQPIPCNKCENFYKNICMGKYVEI